MFDIGFSELMVIALVALVVIGPERMPTVARTLGHLFGRAHRYVGAVKAEISREMQLDDLKKLKAEAEESAQAIESGISRNFQAVEQVFIDARLSAESTIEEASTGVRQLAESAVPLAAAPANSAALLKQRVNGT